MITPWRLDQTYITLVKAKALRTHIRVAVAVLDLPDEGTGVRGAAPHQVPRTEDTQHAACCVVVTTEAVRIRLQVQRRVVKTEGETMIILQPFLPLKPGFQQALLDHRRDPGRIVLNGVLDGIRAAKIFGLQVTTRLHQTEHDNRRYTRNTLVHFPSRKDSTNGRIMRYIGSGCSPSCASA